MKTKQRTVCQNCRDHKIGCDGKRPECSQCVLTKRECKGYNEDWKFVHHAGFLGSPGRSTNTKPTCDIIHYVDEESSKSLWDPSIQVAKDQVLRADLVVPRGLLSSRLSIQTLTEAITDMYLPTEATIVEFIHSKEQICGAWVKELSVVFAQSSTEHADLLFQVIKVLADSVYPHSSTIQYSKTEMSRDYRGVLQMVRTRLAANGRCFELVPTIMCLALAELMFPDSGTALYAHTTAIKVFFETFGPHYFKSGTSHALFQGFRPAIILQAFRDRQPTFLSSESWIKIPFTSACPSAMQALLTDVSTIPFLLKCNDALFENGSSAIQVADMFQSFTDALERLIRWESCLWLESSFPYYWQYGTDAGGLNTCLSLHVPITFNNLTMANCLIHIWAIRIICLAEVERIVLFSSHPIQPRSHTSQFTSAAYVQSQINHFARLILRSMEYFFSDDMKLFGPASTLFPLSMAYQRFTAACYQCDEELEFINSIVTRLIDRGLQSASSLVYGMPGPD